jgi:hypothetical protein
LKNYVENKADKNGSDPVTYPSSGIAKTQEKKGQEKSTDEISYKRKNNTINTQRS